MTIILKSDLTGKQYEIRNFSNFAPRLAQPVQAYALPERPAEEAHLLKIEGNLLKLTLAWTMTNEKTTVVAGENIRTPMQQMLFLSEDFEIKTIIQPGYDLIVNVDGMSKTWHGLPTDFTSTVSKTDPVNYEASMGFQIGVDITVVQDTDEEAEEEE